MPTLKPNDAISAGYPKFIFDPSFESPEAVELYDPENAADLSSFADKHLPDEVTRDYAKRMHFCAWRLRKAKGLVEVDRWRLAYYRLRDEIVVGNRKLVYRAVRRRMMMSNRTDDSIGDCHIVLIQAVAAYNPWMGIRFSTYAFTCLVRALSRQCQRQMKDWLSRSMPLESLPDGEPGQSYEKELVSSGSIRIEEFLKVDHPLLTAREKIVIGRRFAANEEATLTLEKVGQEIGLSKERVRQVQASALNKLRAVLTAEETTV
ncbi:sigma-70 family RNA polymerase sigma factor [Telmatocola sphagniphila]|uniref:Sigma-70 family RNA polymerase sigma factor n=1 Tax=Telmatocola sphagniphila TaxID=1123043 RepID=A0A8E6EYB5_9BACT|nr:sigma-70 family RNA polymerase sigma factor [Telmatocola sphagniphila]QVL32513.1 sigma-70 family RNA polymerase sigma factor [Telmatocola sphagniphila]